MTTEKITDPELKQILSECLSPNEVAWEQLYRRVYPLVRHTIRRAGLEGEDAEDAIAEVYTRLIESVAQIAATRKPVAYIGAMSRYIAIRAKQQEERTIQLPDCSDFGENEKNLFVNESSLNQDKIMQAKMIQEELISAYSKLSTGNRRLIKFKYADELCYEEIAYIEGRESGALRVATHRAIKAWRALMPDEIAELFSKERDIWTYIADFELPAEPGPVVNPEHKILIEELVSGCDMSPEREAFVEELLMNDRDLRELKVKTERRVLAKEDVRGHAEEDEIPPAFLEALMQRIPRIQDEELLPLSDQNEN